MKLTASDSAAVRSMLQGMSNVEPYEGAVRAGFGEGRVSGAGEPYRCEGRLVASATLVWAWPAALQEAGG